MSLGGGWWGGAGGGGVETDPVAGPAAAAAQADADTAQATADSAVDSAASATSAAGVALSAANAAQDAVDEHIADATAAHASTAISGLGTAAVLNVGTGASQVVQLNGSAQLPAVSGALLTDLPGGGGGGTTVVFSGQFGFTPSQADVVLGSFTGTANLTYAVLAADASPYGGVNDTLATNTPSATAAMAFWLRRGGGEYEYQVMGSNNLPSNNLANVTVIAVATT